MPRKIRWLGHAFVEFTTTDDKVILFDPWTKDDGNPGCPFESDKIERADLILVSHDHFDHIGSAVPLARKTGALLGGPVHTMKRLIEEGFDAEQVVNFGSGYMVGGGVNLDWVKTVSTPAFHASDSSCALGNIVTASDGTTIYHAGDTSLFSEMALYGRLYPMDIACIPMGGVFTMDAYQAAEAVNLLKPKAALPIHFASFPIIAKTADEFISLCADRTPDTKVMALQPGEPVEF